MEPTQSTEYVNLDGPSEATLTDPEVQDLYENGFISRAEADVFTIIADFNDGEESLCHA